MTATNNSIWMRLGVSLHGSPEEIGNVLNGDKSLLEKLLREGKFEIYGDTYIPLDIIGEYNQANNTHYEEQDVVFDIISFKSEGYDVDSGETAAFLSKDEIIMPENTEISDEDDNLESILEDTDKCEGFAEIILEDIRTDEEQMHHIGANIIKAYQNGDCDAMLIALCGWSMNSLLAKFNDNKSSKVKICPECQEDTLKYAMIDVDGTNLEEGYSCSECGADFIGIDNEQVIEINPEITTDDE